MTREQILKGIAQVGSLEYQIRWIVNGNSAQYVLLDELIETTIHAAKHRAAHPILSQGSSDQERQAFLRFHDRVAELFARIQWQNRSIAEIVEGDRNMEEIRIAARECLNALAVKSSVDEVMDD
jgi:hypothetical protein